MSLNILNREEKDYIRQRGFRSIEGAPPVGEKYPFLVLSDLSTDSFPILYEISLAITSKPTSKIYPGNASTDELTSIIENLVGRGKRYEGIAFTTKPGEKFKIFFEHIDWLNVVNTIVRKYS